MKKLLSMAAVAVVLVAAMVGVSRAAGPGGDVTVFQQVAAAFGGVTTPYNATISCPADGGVYVAIPDGGAPNEIVLCNGTSTSNVRLYAPNGQKDKGALVGTQTGADATCWNTKAGNNVWKCGSSGSAAETVTLMGVR